MGEAKAFELAFTEANIEEAQEAFTDEQIGEGKPLQLVQPSSELHESASAESEIPSRDTRRRAKP